MTRLPEPLMPGSERVVEDYNPIGSAKAAPESATRYRAAEPGPKANRRPREPPAA
jgi:enoyl-[acyl-carrier-protein] reductase (NADH)